jgi:hypothetical protein
MVQCNAGISQDRDSIFSGVIVLESHQGLCYSCKNFVVRPVLYRNFDGFLVLISAFSFILRHRGLLRLMDMLCSP